VQAEGQLSGGGPVLAFKINRANQTFLFLGLLTLYGCQDLGPGDTQSLLFAKFQRSYSRSFGSIYGLLIASRPVVAWNLVAVLVNFVSVAAYLYFLHKEKAKQGR
jgi:hypothetical protein